MTNPRPTAAATNPLPTAAAANPLPTGSSNDPRPTNPIPIACSWSGGKDSCYALLLSIAQGVIPRAILNVMNENGKISRSHGLPESLLRQQAQALGLPLIAIPSTWEDYQANFIKALQKLKAAYAIEGMVFGDIDLQEHRDWEEMVCEKAELKAILPLWQRDRKGLVFEMLDRPIEAIIVSCNEVMGQGFLGRTIDKSLIAELEAIGVDPCGETGEYHTLVLDCPLFAHRIDFPPYTTTSHNGYNFIQWGGPSS